MKDIFRSVALAFLATGVVTAMSVSPVSAATPKKPKADITVPCKTGKKKAEVWFNPYAAKNPCGAGQWLVIDSDSGDPGDGDDMFGVVDVQPGASFKDSYDATPTTFECGDWGSCTSSLTAYVGQGDWCAGMPTGTAPRIIYRKNSKWRAPDSQRPDGSWNCGSGHAS